MKKVTTTATDIVGNFVHMRELMQSAIKPQGREDKYREQCKKLTETVNAYSQKLRIKREKIGKLEVEIFYNQIFTPGLHFKLTIQMKKLMKSLKIYQVLSVF